MADELKLITAKNMTIPVLSTLIQVRRVRLAWSSTALGRVSFTTYTLVLTQNGARQRSRQRLTAAV
jgi:hypothetical protein